MVISIKSDIGIEISMINRYSAISAVDHELEIPGDNTGHTYIIHLDEIDLQARFFSPYGDTIPIFGFFSGSPDWHT